MVSSLSRVWPFVTPWSRTLPGSSVHGILQTRILEWVAISSSRRSSPPTDGTRVSCIARWILRAEPSGKLVPGFPSMQMWGILQGNQLRVLMVWVPESLYQVVFTTCYSIYIIYVMQTNECLSLNHLDLIFGVWLISMGISSVPLTYVNSDQLSYLFFIPAPLKGYWWEWNQVAL